MKMKENKESAYVMCVCVCVCVFREYLIRDVDGEDKNLQFLCFVV